MDYISTFSHVDVSLDEISVSASSLVNSLAQGAARYILPARLRFQRKFTVVPIYI